MFRRFFLAASLCSLLVACDPNAGKIDQASVTFDGSKQLILVARYTANAQSNGIGAFADVPVGTTGTLEMTGPLHMHCDGTFQAQTAGECRTSVEIDRDSISEVELAASVLRRRRAYTPWSSPYHPRLCR